MSDKSSKWTKKDKIMLFINIITIIVAVASVIINYSQTQKNLELSEKLSYYQIPPTEVLIGSPLQDNEIDSDKTYNTVLSITNNFNNYVIPVHAEVAKVLKNNNEILTGYHITDLTPIELQIQPLDTEDFNFSVKFDDKGEYIIKISINYNYQPGNFYSGKTQWFDLRLHVS
jgi:hypothetical protein